MRLTTTGIIALAIGLFLATTAKPQQAPAQKSTAASNDDLIKVEGTYEGKWVTTWHKKLDGTTKCAIKQLSRDRWQGRFWGEWQRVPFDYTVEFAKRKTTKSEAAPPKSNRDNLLVEGKAMIDGADYDWKGTLTPDAFDIQFTGSRYHGSLKLFRIPDQKAAKATAKATPLAADRQPR